MRQREAYIGGAGREQGELRGPAKRHPLATGKKALGKARTCEPFDSCPRFTGGCPGFSQVEVTAQRPLAKAAWTFSKNSLSQA
jgi:hypothetical protein